MVDPWILAFSLVTVGATIWMGFRSAKSSKSAADFFVAGRSVSVGWNASAISGEYLSAASFMGVAGMVMSAGYDALWYPVCYACGYLFLLLFIAGPLRRFGAYTIPDFAEGRYDSPVFRKIAVVFVLFIGFFYTMPQMKGAGTTLAYVFKDITWFGQAGLPYWVGVVVVGAVITLNVALGGMKGITLIQAFQYWLKMFAISVPIFVLMSVYGGYGRQLEQNKPALKEGTQAPGIALTPPVQSDPTGEIPLPAEAGPQLVRLRNVPAAETWDIYERLVGRTMLPRSNATLEKMDELLQGQLTRLGLIQRLHLKPSLVTVGPEGDAGDGTVVPVDAAVVKRALEAAYSQGGITLVPVGDAHFRAIETSKLDAYRAAALVSERPAETTNLARVVPVQIRAPAGESVSTASASGLYYRDGGMHRGFSRWKNLWTDFRGQERRMLVSLPSKTYSLPDILLKYCESHVWHRGVKSVSGLVAVELSGRQIPYAQPRPLSRVEFDQHVTQVLADNGITLVHLTPEEYKVVPTASAAKYGVEFREVPSGSVRQPLPAKAPADATWLNPFGPLTTRAARASLARTQTEFELVNSSPALAAQIRPLGQTIYADNLLGLIARVRAAFQKPPASNWRSIVSPGSSKVMAHMPGPLSVYAAASGKPVLWQTNLASLPPFLLDVTHSPTTTDEEFATMVAQGLRTNGVSLVTSPDNVVIAVASDELTRLRTESLKAGEAAVRPFALLYTYSLIIALVCGTAGLPHILVRFYTNPDGVAAKRTTMWVMILIGIFYVFPPVFGVMGRNLMPSLYEGAGVNGTDGIVLKLPTVLGDRFGVMGSILSGITCAGAFAAFMSTFSGLLVSMTGALAHDVYGRILRPRSTPAERMKMFKFCAVLIGAVAIFLGTLVENFEINFMVGQAFAIAAASYFPLLFMSVWWRGMTTRGAATGMLAGGLLAVAAISLTSWTTFLTAQAAKFKALGTAEPGWFVALKPYSLTEFWAAHPLLRILGEQPAIWAVPLAITLMIVVSKLTRAQVPADIRDKMLVLHAPEALGLRQDYIRDHEAAH